MKMEPVDSDSSQSSSINLPTITETYVESYIDQSPIGMTFNVDAPDSNEELTPSNGNKKNLRGRRAVSEAPADRGTKRNRASSEGPNTDKRKKSKRQKLEELSAEALWDPFIPERVYLSGYTPEVSPFRS